MNHEKKKKNKQRIKQITGGGVEKDIIFVNYWR